MNSMLHRLLRKDRANDQKTDITRRETTGCGGVLLALSLAIAAALLALLSA